MVTKETAMVGMESVPGDCGVDPRVEELPKDILQARLSIPCYRTTSIAYLDFSKTLRLEGFLSLSFLLRE